MPYPESRLHAQARYDQTARDYQHGPRGDTNMITLGDERAHIFRRHGLASEAFLQRAKDYNLFTVKRRQKDREVQLALDRAELEERYIEKALLLRLVILPSSPRWVLPLLENQGS